MKRKILVVDDEKMLRDLFKHILEQANYEVIVAEDGVNGIAKCKYEKPDLVILDGLMPKMHGFLVCKEIKKLEDAPKVILLTGVYTKPSYKLEAKYQYNADELLTKPISPGDLLASVEKLLAGLPEHRPELQAQVASTETLGGQKTSDFEAPRRPRPTGPTGYSANWKAFLKGDPLSSSR